MTGKISEKYQELGDLLVAGKTANFGRDMKQSVFTPER